MVKDGIYYGMAFVCVALVLGYFSPWLAIAPVLLACFFLWFFRDPERTIPDIPGAIVSPADGKVTDVRVAQVDGRSQWRISIFLNVFNVHVNRTPIGGVIEAIEYRKGKFGNAMGEISSEQNEQNIVTVRDGQQTLVFKQIAGLIARRIVFNKKLGDKVSRGERIGLIKFGSRCDVVFESTAEVKVKVGDIVKGGSSILAVAGVPAGTASGDAKTSSSRQP